MICSRLELAHLEKNVREDELTKHVRSPLSIRWRSSRSRRQADASG